MTVHFAKVHAAQTAGLRARIVDVETDITKKTLHAFSIVGLPDKAVEESRDRVSSAIKHTGFKSPKSKNQKVVVSLAPADLKKEGPAFDVAVSLSYLLASKDVSFDPRGKIFLGELSLDGKIRPVRGVLLAAREAKRTGFSEIFVPKENAREAALIRGIAVFSVHTLHELLEHVSGVCQIAREKETNPGMPSAISTTAIDFSDVRGQESAKRALEIAAAGGHNIAMWGPPGTGKTMLARACSGILPPLDFEDIVEVTGIHSVAGALLEDAIVHAPFRSPHHTSSYVSIVGGGGTPRPGEITLAHKGVLFLDEFPEFESRVIESLRQPLEDRLVTISRAKGTEVFPADIMLIAAFNPCPCGNRGSEKTCDCSQQSLAKYARKLSGPVMDRIDMWVSVGRVETKRLSADENAEGSAAVRTRVQKARRMQAARHKKRKLNASLSARDLGNAAWLSPDARETLERAGEQSGISARGFHKLIKVARTIADLDGEDIVSKNHAMEALQFRQKISF